MALVVPLAINGTVRRDEKSQSRPISGADGTPGCQVTDPMWASRSTGTRGAR